MATHIEVDSGADATGASGRRAPDWLVLAIACTAQFMVVLDVSIVNVALPSIRHDLVFSETDLQWIVNAYTLTFAGFLLLGGRAGDLYGRRRVFLLGLALFTLASIAGGLAHNQAMLITARAVQGLGGAVLSPATLTILTTTFKEGRARAKAMGAWSAVAGAGGAVGALLGGFLTQYLSWRWIFLINVPIAIAGFIVARIFLPETKDLRRSNNLDIGGAVLVTGGLTSLVYGTVRTNVVGWTAPQTLGAIGLATVLLGWFISHEHRVAKAPLMPLRLFSSRSVTGANLVMMGLGAALFSMWFFMSLYLQGVLHYSPFVTGLAFFPQTAAIIVGSQVSSRLVSRIGPRPLLVIGPLVSALGLVGLWRLGVDSGYWPTIFVPSVIAALGGGLAFAPVAIAATSGVAPSDAGLASGLVNTARQVGGSIGLAALATVAASRTASVLAGAGGHTPLAVAKAATDGYTEAFLIGAGIAVLTALAALIVPPIAGRVPQQSQAPSVAE